MEVVMATVALIAASDYMGFVTDSDGFNPQHAELLWGKMNICLHFKRFPTTTTMYFCDGVNTLNPRQHERHLPNDIFKYIFLNENVWISIKMSWNFVSNGSTNNISVLIQIMAWHRPGDKALSEPMMVSLLTHICVTRRKSNAVRSYLLAPNFQKCCRDLTKRYHLWIPNGHTTQ